MYLLPAGDSTFLGGVKSMVVDPFPPGQLLSQRLSARYVPLQNEKVLIITGRGKTADAKVPLPSTHLPSLSHESADRGRKLIISSCMRWGQDLCFNMRC